MTRAGRAALVTAQHSVVAAASAVSRTATLQTAASAAPVEHMRCTVLQPALAAGAVKHTRTGTVLLPMPVAARMKAGKRATVPLPLSSVVTRAVFPPTVAVMDAPLQALQAQHSGWAQ